MADDLNTPYQYPFEQPSEDAVRFRDGAIEGRPAGVPASYDEGGSTRWTPEAISEVHALAQLGRYQVRGFNTFNKRMPTFDDLTFVPASMTGPGCHWRGIARVATRPPYWVAGAGSSRSRSN